VYPTKDLTITIVDGQKVKGVGQCHKISIQIQELELQTRFYALPLNEMDMVLGAEWLMQLGTYTTNLEEQFMEFNWQGQHYKLYGVEGSTLKKNELQLMKKMQEAQTNIQQQKQGKYVTKKHQGFTLNNQVKRLQNMMQTIQRDLTNTQSRNKVKPLQPDKDKDDAAKETCSARENPIYYALRTKHSLRGWQCNKHNYSKQ
jgi:hypothetical protein